MAKTPERFLWAAALAGICPGDQVLEIGCGTGLLAGQVAMRLGSKGKVLAIDRSTPMLEKAKRHNRAYIEKGVAEFRAIAFEDAPLPTAFFDRVLAFNVPFFWKDPARELAVVKEVLKPQGALYVFCQAPFEITIDSAAPIRKTLLEHQFSIVDIQLQPLQPTAAFCIIARPKG